LNETEAHSAALGVSAASSPSVEDASAPRAHAWTTQRWLGWGPASAAAVVGALSLFAPIGWSGLWAPYELEVADFARRIAVTLHGAEALAIPGANNTVPTLSDLGKGQLPFSSVAIGFQLLGLSDWAGRLPLALTAAAGVAALFALVSRLMDRVAAAYSAIALVTMPLYFLHARTMLGDGVTLAAASLAVAGLGVSTFAPSARWTGRVGWVLLALLGLIAGFGARGLLLGVAVPALGTGLGWLAWRLAGFGGSSRASSVAGALSLAIGVAACGLGLWVMLRGSPDAYLELLGAKHAEPAKLPTHDSSLHQLGFGLFPWSAIAPCALALVLGQERQSSQRAAVRFCLACVVVVALALHGLTAPHVGVLPFVGTFAIAGLIGIAFRDAENPEQRMRLIALVAAALLVVFLSDLRSYPDEALLPFAVGNPSWPESFTAPAKRWMTLGTLGCLLVMLPALADLPSERQPPALALRSGRRWLDALGTAYGGKLRWALGAVALLLGAAALASRLAARGVGLPLPPLFSERPELFTALFALVPLVVFGPCLALIARDLLIGALSMLPFPRARLGLIALSAFGLALSLGYYPALAAQVSPRDVFESFRQQAKPGEPLAVLGQAAKVAPYYAGPDVRTPKTARAGLDFLLEAPAERRWLVFGAKDLGTLNQLYRQNAKPPSNLPVLDAISSEVLLASNQLLPGETNQNPLAAWIGSERPTPARPLDVDLNGQLRCLGWAVTERDGTPVDEARAGQPYDFRIYYEVLASVSGSWKTFIHIDGNRRRFNGDHDTLQGKYPFRLWQKGDYVVDVYPFELEPHFAGTTYDVFFGLFSGDKRMTVKHGKHSDNRIEGGRLVVR
jgi:4-amino-4-deoxy-L-arabinose transferase-like glycosyltransferase